MTYATNIDTLRPPHSKHGFGLCSLLRVSRVHEVKYCIQIFVTLYISFGFSMESLHQGNSKEYPKAMLLQAKVIKRTKLPAAQLSYLSLPDPHQSTWKQRLVWVYAGNMPEGTFYQEDPIINNKIHNDLCLYTNEFLYDQICSL